MDGYSLYMNSKHPTSKKYYVVIFAHLPMKSWREIGQLKGFILSIYSNKTNNHIRKKRIPKVEQEL